MSRVLAIDTTGSGGSVALGDDGVVVARVEHDRRQGYAEELFGLFDRLLAESGLGLETLDGIAVVRGPGSFTGLRIGVMTAKTLARARGLTLLTCGTLELLASAAISWPRSGELGSGAGSERATGSSAGSKSAAGSGAAEPRVSECPQRVLAALEAGGGNVFAASYELLGPTGELRRGPERLERQALLRWATESSPPPERLVGWGEDLARWLAGEFESRAQPDGPRLCAIGSLAGLLAMHASAGRWPTTEISALELMPLYLSPSQAERVHGLDLADEVHRPVPPRAWE